MKIQYAHNDTDSFVNNNILALAIGGVLAIGLAYLIAKLRGRDMTGKIDPAAIVGISFAIVLMTAGLVWHWRDRSGSMGTHTARRQP